VHAQAWLLHGVGVPSVVSLLLFANQRGCIERGPKGCLTVARELFVSFHSLRLNLAAES
jgi:hypothetical protein